MKKLKKLLSIFLICIIIFFTVPCHVMASEAGTDIDTMATVTIKANVPNGFRDEIVFTLERKLTQIRYSVSLVPENNYTESVSLVSGKSPERNSYTASVLFPNSSDEYNTDIAENYNIKGEKVELVFNVSPVTYSTENSNINENNETTHGDENKDSDKDPDTGGSR